LYPKDQVTTDFDYDPVKNGNTWIQVRLKTDRDYQKKGPLYYIHSYYLTQSSPRHFTPPFEKGDLAVIRNTSGLGVLARKDPDLNSQVLFSLAENDIPIPVHDIKGSWVCFRHFSNSLGWVPIECTGVVLPGMQFLVTPPAKDKTPYDLADKALLSKASLPVFRAWPSLFSNHFGRLNISAIDNIKGYLNNLSHQNVSFSSFQNNRACSIYGEWDIFKAGKEYFLVNTDAASLLGLNQSSLLLYYSQNSSIGSPDFNMAGESKTHFFALQKEITSKAFGLADKMAPAGQRLLKIPWPANIINSAAVNNSFILRMTPRGILTFLDPLYSKIRYFSISGKNILGEFSLLRTEQHKRCSVLFSDFINGPQNLKALFNQSLRQIEIYDTRGFVLNTIEGFTPLTKLFFINLLESPAYNIKNRDSMIKKGEVKNIFYLGAWSPETGTNTIFDWNGNYILSFKSPGRPFFKGAEYYTVQRAPNKTPVETADAALQKASGRWILKKYNLWEHIREFESQNHKGSQIDDTGLTVLTPQSTQETDLSFMFALDNEIALIGMDKVFGNLLFNYRPAQQGGAGFAKYNLIDKSFFKTGLLPQSPFSWPFCDENVCLTPGGDSLVFIEPFWDLSDNSKSLYLIPLKQ
jgi:hypothetical protein